MKEGGLQTEKQIKAGYYYKPKPTPPVHVGMFVVKEGEVTMPGSQFELYRRMTVTERPIKVRDKVTLLPSVSRRKAVRKKELPIAIPIPIKPRPGSLFEEYARKYGK